MHGGRQREAEHCHSPMWRLRPAHMHFVSQVIIQQPLTGSLSTRSQGEQPCPDTISPVSTSQHLYWEATEQVFSI